MRIILKSKEKGDGTFTVELVTPEETIQLGAYIKSSTDDIITCRGWDMTLFVAKMFGIERNKLLHLVDREDVIVDIDIQN